ncbi:hypothetical protein XO10_00675 [Marinitoga sp. 1135]|uniref:helix-turn-helix domain-containing protein n=1 Tax=Marinitoga sp. 1135 TaxID=1643333 RepID=UPI0015867FA6|nr:helix-turn-helix transcriptional regulator [Marinitoga sp. 1135]NUU94832.1 hypothetical protein [Marinitoga sp. 1135]
MIINKIDEILKKQNKSIYWLAQQTGMSYSNLHKTIKDKNRTINFDNLDKIMKALEITDFNEILELIDDE